MMLPDIEPDSAGADLRIFRCLKCAATGKIRAETSLRSFGADWMLGWFRPHDPSHNGTAVDELEQDKGEALVVVSLSVATPIGCS
jgi:hypothetical protein